MKIYIGYSRYCGPEEGAVLVFANNAKEARKVAYSSLVGLGIVEDWIDCAVRWLRESDFLFEQADNEKIWKGIAHVIDDPVTCKECEMWGGEQLEDGTCSMCD